MSYSFAQLDAPLTMKKAFRSHRFWIALLVWVGTSYIFAAGMEGFTEPQESFVGLLFFAAVMSAVLHGAYIVTTLSRRQLGPRLTWALAVGLLPATILSGIVVAQIVTSLPQRLAGFTLASVLLLLYADAWRLLLQRVRRPIISSHIAAL
jgi:glycerol uptake facilitator-like aquaporin